MYDLEMKSGGGGGKDVLWEQDQRGGLWRNSRRTCRRLVETDWSSSKKKKTTKCNSFYAFSFFYNIKNSLKKMNEQG